MLCKFWEPPPVHPDCSVMPTFYQLKTLLANVYTYRCITASLGSSHAVQVLGAPAIASFGS